MAAIDKIYGTYSQNVELWDWVQSNAPKYLRYVTEPDAYKHLPDNHERNLSCFSKEADMWLLDNCPMKWVTDRIRQQYAMPAKHRKEPLVKVRKGNRK